MHLFSDQIKDGDLIHSLATVMSENLGQIVHLTSAKHNVRRAYFCGSFISEEPIRNQIIRTIYFRNARAPKVENIFFCVINSRTFKVFPPECSLSLVYVCIIQMLNTFQQTLTNWLWCQVLFWNHFVFDFGPQQLSEDPSQNERKIQPCARWDKHTNPDSLISGC